MRLVDPDLRGTHIFTISTTRRSQLKYKRTESVRAGWTKKTAESGERGAAKLMHTVNNDHVHGTEDIPEIWVNKL